MDNRYFNEEQFINQFGREMVVASDVYKQRSKTGIIEYAMAAFDFTFISDWQTKLESLGKFLAENYNYKIKDIIPLKDNTFELNGDTTEFPVDENNLTYWALDLYCKGYEFDCELVAYGAISDTKDQRFPAMESVLFDYYFDLAMEAFDLQNFGMAHVHLSTSIKINPGDPNAWYSRAIVKENLRTWKAARRDYDQAIKLAPDFVDAIVNRGANKDEQGEYDAAIQDYDLAIAIHSENGRAYFNRGNSKYNNSDSEGACRDWKKAKELGEDDAQERIDEFC
jgi:tetratricopeptide (TPR) repeat protein